MNPKQLNQKAHTIAVLANLLIENLDDIQASSNEALLFKEKLNDLIPFCEQIITDVYAVQQVKSSTYLTDLSTKVDTVIRKSYQYIGS